jgi:2-oxoglutarate dehydrogenase E2 component (dihydrolipoamide succinyltransferase)
LIGSENGAPAAAPPTALANTASAPAQKQAEEATAQATGADVTATQTPAAAQPAHTATKAENVTETEGRSYDYDRPDAVQEAQTSAPASSNGGMASSGNVSSNGSGSVEDLRRTKSSPLVRNIAKEHGVDISKVHGSGMSGRVTKKDIMSFIDSGAGVRPEDLLIKAPASAPAVAPQTAPPAVQTPAAQPAQQRAAAFTQPQISSAVGDRVEPMSVMRKKIAEHMTFSKQTSAHVTSVYEIDMTNVARFRDRNKSEFQARYGTKLTFMPFIFQAVTQALRKLPVINAQVSGDQIVYKGDVNLGMAVALDWGLIVPVIKRADQLSLSGLALAANDLADRARTKKLNPDEVQGGTFTITNPGVFGGLFGTPIINQPQVAILCVGTIEKRAKVVTTAEGDDVIAIRSMAYFALTYDHRIVDGSDGEKFLSFLKEYLETTQFGL